MIGSAPNAYGDRTQAERDARLARMHAIADAPEASGRPLMAFALAIRGDIPAGRAIKILAEAPELHGTDAIRAWADAILARPPLEIVR